MAALHHRGAVVPDRVEGDAARPPGPNQDVGKTFISLLVLRVSIRSDEAIEDLASREGQLCLVFVQHVLNLGDDDERLTLRPPLRKALWAFGSVDPVFAARLGANISSRAVS